MSAVKQEKGFSIIEIVIVIVFLAIVITGGVWFFNRKTEVEKASASTTQVVSSQNLSEEVPEVKGVDDLKNVKLELNNIDFGNTEVSDLNSQLDF